MWRLLRIIYLIAYWALIPTLIALTVWAWRVMPGTLFGIRWVWHAGIFLFVFAICTLSITISFSNFPLPPEVSPTLELRRWLLNLLTGIGASLLFLLLFLPLMYAMYVLKLLWDGELLDGELEWLGVLAPFLELLIIPGWFIGVILLLGKMKDLSIVKRFREWNLRQHEITEKDIAALLKKVDLPSHQRKTMLERLQHEGLTEEFVLEMIDTLQPYLDSTFSYYHEEENRETIYVYQEELHPLERFFSIPKMIIRELPRRFSKLTKIFKEEFMEGEYIRRARYAQLIELLNDWLELHSLNQKNQ